MVLMLPKGMVEPNVGSVGVAALRNTLHVLPRLKRTTLSVPVVPVGLSKKSNKSFC